MIVLKHCFVGIVIFRSCFILFPQSFINKTKAFYCIFLSLFSGHLKLFQRQVMSFAFFFTMIYKPTKEKTSTTKCFYIYYRVTDYHPQMYHLWRLVFFTVLQKWISNHPIPYDQKPNGFSLVIIHLDKAHVLNILWPTLFKHLLAHAFYHCLF